jgi:hypothetical protein
LNTAKRGRGRRVVVAVSFELADSDAKNGLLTGPPLS